MLLGDLLALVSAITFGLYSVAGRSQRERYGLFTYTGTVYGFGRVVGAARGAAVPVTPAGYNPKSLLALLLAGLIPAGAGAHAVQCGAAARRMRRSVNLIATQEVWAASCWARCS